MPDADEQLRRLRWQCRRGMRELDMMLAGFLDAWQQQPGLVDANMFACLLEQSDETLLAWLMGRQHPMDREFAKVVETIRQVTAAAAAGVPATVGAGDTAASGSSSGHRSVHH